MISQRVRLSSEDRLGLKGAGPSAKRKPSGSAAADPEGGVHKESEYERRRRLASSYLQTLKLSGIETITGQLQQEVMKLSEDAFVKVADKLAAADLRPVQFRAHKLSPTCIELVNASTLVTASKDGTTTSWRIDADGDELALRKNWTVTGKTRLRGDSRHPLLKRRSKIPTRGPWNGGHFGPILSLAVAESTIFTGGEDTVLLARSLVDGRGVESFVNNRSPVTSLCATDGSLLFGGTKDAVVRCYDAHSLHPLTVLHGHTGAVLALAAAGDGRAVSGGGLGCNSLRLWRSDAASQLVYRAPGEVEAVVVPRRGLFLSGDRNGRMCLWSQKKKTPVFTQAVGDASCAGWVSSLAVLPGTDLAFSGSGSGKVCAWRVDEDRITCVKEIPINGFVNAMSVGRVGDKAILFCAVGQEPRLGRWERIASAKNSIVAVALPV
eukprot:gnl/Chilomastix_cuspidata/948.p1 GENE.gnl/Chilomastix_cuspidata/948~~gnl/Chilomastix_cuspidata/948.p1  ORF type:complete len:437 (-),score=138.65 gnl/Chilomastix_cuspidata/948:50-1360(-)